MPRRVLLVAILTAVLAASCSRDENASTVTVGVGADATSSTSQHPSVSSAVVTTQAAGTTARTETTTKDSAMPLGGMEGGLFCRELADLGLTYTEAVAYWARDRQPARMDADRNGILCETVYDRAAVVAFWGEPLPTTTSTTAAAMPTTLPPATTTTTTTTTTTLPIDAIGDVPPGKFCRDTHAMGFGYPETVAYWMREGMPGRMDADSNGVPCETVFPADDVERVFGSPAALSVYFFATFGGAPEPRFVATGPAVDAGVICPAGTAGYVAGGNNRWEDEYVCDDGTGTFIAGADIYIYADGREYAAWSIVSGTGLYADVTGGGGTDTGPADNGLWQDHMYGRLERPE